MTHEKERSVAYLKLAIAETLTEDNLLINGFTSLLIPTGIAHVLKVCLITDMKYRGSLASSSGMSESEALSLLPLSLKGRGMELSIVSPKFTLSKSFKFTATLM